jgi:hypothetical protein
LWPSRNARIDSFYKVSWWTEAKRRRIATFSNARSAGGFDGLGFGDNVPDGVRKAVDALRGPDHRVRRGHTAIITRESALFAPLRAFGAAPS